MPTESRTFEGLSPLKQAYLLLEQKQAEIEALRGGRQEPIAVIGVGCRFPGGADDPEAYWRLLESGTDTAREVPTERWEVDRYFDPHPGTPGRSYSKHAHFLDRVGGFDADLFHISPREAVSLDPQQRLLLEVTWEALEHAGIAPVSLKGTRTGIYIGIMTQDYAWLCRSNAGANATNPYVGTGNDLSFAAGRLSYVLGTLGPSLPVVAACSSSLAAVHLACQALRLEECTLAIVGGVNLMLSPEPDIVLSQMRAIAADGRCRSFAAEASGYGRGEGCGVVVLKRCSDARRDRDRILALVRGSAVNHNGPSSGLTVPNPRAQEEVIRSALQSARLEAAAVRYVEAHGTGTTLGDAIEAQALAAVFSDRRDAGDPLWIGSVKSNIGHLEAAAGVAGLIKVVLALMKRRIPASLHCERPSSSIPWSDIALDVVRRSRPWSPNGTPLVAGVSSFGMSGINAHVIVEEAPLADAPVDATRPRHALALSARTSAALEQLVGRYRDLLASRRDGELPDICYTANTGRTHFAEYRLAVSAADVGEASQRLARIEPPRLTRCRDRAPAVAWLFTGQGSQYVDMGRRLYETSALFRKTLDDCDRWLESSLGRSLLSVVLGGAAGEDLDDTLYTQPALFALELALARLWQSWGVEPVAVIGHSVGEYVAACLADVFSWQDGLSLVAARARLMAGLPRVGKMVVVLAGEQRARAQIGKCERAVSIAAVNGPEQVVLSGEVAAVDLVAGALAAEGCRIVPLSVSHAFHSHLMEPVLDQFHDACRKVELRRPRLPLISNVTGDVVTDELTRPDYWVRHLRSAVRFHDGLRALAGMACDTFIEIGPNPVLLQLTRQSLPNADHLRLPSLQRGRPDWEQLLESLEHLYMAGATIDWSGFDLEYRRNVVSVPTYPFQHRRYWIETAAPATGDRYDESGAVVHPGAGERLPTAVGAEPEGPEGASPGAALGWAEWLYEVRWRPRIRRAEADPVATFPSPASIAGHVATGLASADKQDGIRKYRMGLRRLDELATTYVTRALVAENWRPGAGLDSTSLAERLGVVPRHKRLLARLVAMMNEDGLVASDGDHWRIISVPVLADGAEISSLIRRELPEAEAELTLLERCGSRLSQVLRGEQDPLELLFTDDDAGNTAALYLNSPGARLLNGLVKEAVQSLVSSLPYGRGIRLLEIGAGTGGTTAEVLSVLPARRCKYVFTDVSPAFTARAAEQLSGHEFVRCATLDIEKDPASQGFSAHSYDVVIAAHVLHATRDLSQAVRHASCLLAPGGILLLLEATRPQRWLDLIFGLTEGWWRFEDRELRPEQPLLGADRWKGVLHRNGFDAIEVVPQVEAGDDFALTIARSAAAEEPSTARAAGDWLIFADRGGVGDGLAARLRQAGGVCTLIASPPTDVHSQTRRASTIKEAVEHFSTSSAPGGRIVFLRALDASSEPAVVGELPTDARTWCTDVLQIIQSMIETGAATRAWLATRATQQTGSRSGLASPAGAALWGVFRTANLEHPHFRFGCIDLDPIDTYAMVRSILDELLADEGETQVAFHDGCRYVARLHRYSSPASGRKADFRPAADRSYLVTGGLGGLGLEIARWLARKGARHLTLASRGNPSAAAARAIADVEASGSEVTVVAADVGCEAQVAALVDRFGKTLPPLAGIFHLAGVLDDGVLSEQSGSRFSRVLQPKVGGATFLHRSTERLPLDLFVLFSSAASVFGSPAQSNHAAANAVLDGFAHWRRCRGLPALSVNWGAWSEIGAAARAAGSRRHVAATGSISPALGLDILEELLCSGATQVAAIPIDWALLQSQVDRESFFEEFRKRTITRDRRQSDLLSRLRRSPTQRRRGILQQYLAAKVAAVLGRDAGDAAVLERGFFDLGLDSLTSLELRNSIQGDLAVSLPTALLFDYPSVGALAGHLDGLVAAQLSLPALPALSIPQAMPAAGAGPLDDLTMDELTGLLDSKLETLTDPDVVHD